jgi:hypothetical protein
LTVAPAALVASSSNGWNGTLRKGAFVSCTVTVNVRVAVLPRVSEAEHVTEVGPKGNCDPDGGLHVTGRGPSTLSLAVAVKVTMAPAELVACRI